MFVTKPRLFFNYALPASALLNDLPLPLRLEFAALVASHVALALGGRANLPTREKLRTADLSTLSGELRTHIQDS